MIPKIRGQFIRHNKLKGLTVENLELIIKLGYGLVFDENGNIKLKSDVVTVDTNQNISGQKTFYIAPLIKAEPASEDSAITKGFVDTRFKEYCWGLPIFTKHQLVNGPNGGIRPGAFIAIIDYIGITNEDEATIYFWYELDDGLQSFEIILTKNPTSSNHVDISDHPDAPTLAVRIVTAIKDYSNDNDIAKLFADYTFHDDERVYVIFKNIVTLKQLDITTTENIDEYVLINNASDVNLGLPQDDIPEYTSYPLELENTAAIWNTYLEQWGFYGIEQSSATSDEAGVVKIGDGIAIAPDGTISVDTDNETITLVGVTPNKKVAISPTFAGTAVSIVDNKLNVLVDTLKGITVSDNHLAIKLAENGGLSFNSNGEIQVSDSTVPISYSETHIISSTDLSEGYFELSHTPRFPQSVQIFAVNGICHVNKKANQTTELADFDVCTEPGSENRIYIKNNKTEGNYTSSGLAEEYEEGDILVIHYEY